MHLMAAFLNCTVRIQERSNEADIRGRSGLPVEGSIDLFSIDRDIALDPVASSPYTEMLQAIESDVVLVPR